MEYKDFDKLSLGAKMEALRAGHSLLLNHEDLPVFIKTIAPYLETKGEHISIERIGTINSDIRIFNVEVIPILETRAVE